MARERSGRGPPVATDLDRYRSAKLLIKDAPRADKLPRSSDLDGRRALLESRWERLVADASPGARTSTGPSFEYAPFHAPFGSFWASVTFFVRLPIRS